MLLFLEADPVVMLPQSVPPNLDLKPQSLKKKALVEFVLTGVVSLQRPCLKVPRFYEYIKHAEDYGIEASGKPNFDAVIKRSRGVADKMSKGVQFLMRKNKIDVVMGFGKLLAKGKIEVTAADGKKQL